MSRPCILCGNLKNNEIGSLDDYSIRECSKCFLQFLDPIPVRESLSKIYSDYYKSWDYCYSGNEVSRMKKATFQRYLKLIIPHISSGTLLDVGCATGELMQTAQDLGFDVYGVEISPYGIHRCREKFGHNKIIDTNLKAGDFPLGFFNLITLSDVIEHILEPVLFIDLLWSLLKPNGFLMIVTPDTSSFIKKIMGMHWPHYKEEHVYYYNRSNIIQLLSPRFKTIVLDKVYKTLTLDYVANILKAYSNYSGFRTIAYMLKLFPSRLRLQLFKVSIGEMLVLCRKK